MGELFLSEVGVPVPLIPKKDKDEMSINAMRERVC
jgi:hypothetical protein